MVNLFPLGPSESLTFHYAIRFPSKNSEFAAMGIMGMYYTGPNYLGKERIRQDSRANQGSIRDAYTYTENRAYDLIASNPLVFDGCKVERVL